MALRKKIPALLLLASACMFTQDASAVTRQVYFGQIGVNSTSIGVSTAVDNITCIITLTNVSTSVQEYNYDFTVNATGTGAGAPVGGSSPVNNGSTWTALAAGATLSLTFIYPAFPATTVGSQTLQCRGRISVRDQNAATPGFAIANGTLLTFIEGGSINSTLSMSGGRAVRGAQAIYTQVPISINKGKPF